MELLDFQGRWKQKLSGIYVCISIVYYYTMYVLVAYVFIVLVNSKAEYVLIKINV